MSRKTLYRGGMVLLLFAIAVGGWSVVRLHAKSELSSLPSAFHANRSALECLAKRAAASQQQALTPEESSNWISECRANMTAEFVQMGGGWVFVTVHGHSLLGYDTGLACPVEKHDPPPALGKHFVVTPIADGWYYYVVHRG